ASYSLFSLIDLASAGIYTLSLHDALPIWMAIKAIANSDRKDANLPSLCAQCSQRRPRHRACQPLRASRSPHSTQKFAGIAGVLRSEEHTSELQSLAYLVCRLLLEKKKKKN